MKELVVISGKGGTGKTSIAACLAVLAGKCVTADCDVDAADLHLVLAPTILERHPFQAGKRARIRAGRCVGCGACTQVCRFDAIHGDGPGNGTVARTFLVDPLACEGCGVCTHICPQGAIALEPVLSGEWFVSETRCGPMVHAKLGIAQSNSGKLVSVVRQKARALAQAGQTDLVIIDGSPGIGCPVIASITGSSLVLVITEPTPSGEHDLERVVQLSRHFGVPLLVCINKYDLSIAMSDRIEAYCRQQCIPVAGRIRYDRVFTHAQMKAQTVVEATEEGAVRDIRSLWQAVQAQLNMGGQKVA